MQLIYDEKNKKVIMLFDAPDVKLSTKQEIFKGTFAECMTKIQELGLSVPEYDPFLVERIFKAKKECVKSGRMTLIPDNDVLALDVVTGVKVHEDEDNIYMRCSLSKETLESLFDNTDETDLNPNVVSDLGLTNSFVCKSLGQLGKG